MRERERERNVLFNDALNTFYLRLYGVRDMVKDHSDSEKGNPLPAHRLLLSINSKGSSHRQYNTYHGLCYTSRGALAGTRNIRIMHSNINMGARCSSVVRAFAHDSMGRRIDPSWGGTIELFLVSADINISI